MASSVIRGLCLLMIFYGRITAGVNGEEPSGSSFSRYGCAYCCSRIDNQTTILKHISIATEKLTKDVGEIKEDDIPSELKRQAAYLEKQSAELNGMKASIGDIAISLNKHSEDLLVHDARLEKQELLLERINSLVKEMHDSLIEPRDCSDIRALGHRTSGVYRVYPGNLAKRIEADVYCDMTTPGGNWLVFQRRKDGSVNFERTWSEYLNGFGIPGGEFWLGNEVLYLLTSKRNYKLRIDMEDFDGQKRYAEYSTFSISSSADRYRLKVTGYTGDAGDSLSHHSGMQFSTKDADNDIHKEASCSLLFRGAWWFSACHASNLNGVYFGGPQKTFADGIDWYTFRGHYYSLKTTEMKITVVN